MSDEADFAAGRALPISLYLDLEPGQFADLETTARASIAFAEAIRELAYILDPSAEIRIAVQDSTRGSLSVNALVEALKSARREHPKLFAVLVAMALWMGGQTAEYTYERVLDLAIDLVHPAKHKLTDEDIHQLAAEVADLMQKGAARKKVQEVYRQVDRDPAVKAVGIGAGAGAQPFALVPKSEFHRRAAGALATAMTRKRERPERLQATLISPILLDSERRWKFRAYFGEFGATMDDHDFTDELLSGTLVLSMASGIEMDLDAVATEEYSDGVWKVLSWSIKKVHRVEEHHPQMRLAFVARSNQSRDHEKDN